MIRKASINDLDTILGIYASAKEFMHASGNPNQWNGAYPDRNTLLCDMEKEHLYVMYDEDEIYGVFALIGGIDETYGYIEGAWRSDTPYGTIHRIAGNGKKHGIMKECLDFATLTYDHLRVDTHEDNIPMQNAVKKCGFEYAGIIYLKDGAPRLAYDRVNKNCCN